MSPISTNYASSATTGQGSSASTPNTPAAVTKNMFLQLLVAQLRNQDPMSPSDGTQFVAQLAQFQQMEQSVNMGQDITAIRKDLDQTASQTIGGAVTKP